MCPSMSGEELWCRCRARGGAALASPGALERDEWAAGPGPGPMEQGMPMNGGRFDFDDGGTYCGGWEDGKAHGHGVCTGPKGQGEYSGAWHYGFEVSGIYTWPSGNTYEGQWQNGKRHGLGVEKRGRWLYRGEWSQGYKGRYGMRQSTNSQAKYEGTWSSGLQDGYGTETYADGGTYEGQWLRGMRHGYGIRKSAPYGVAAKYRSRSHAHASLTSLRSEMGDQDTAGAPPPAPSSKRHVADESRGGFVLRAHSEPPVRRRSLSERSIAVKRTILQGLRITKQRSTGDIHARVSSGTGETPRSIRSSGSTASCTSDESGFGGAADDAGGHHSLAQEEFLDPATTETYMGEWKNDKRSGFGISERSDGLKYEGEWFSNKKFGYGATTLKDGTREEGKYKNNILVTSQRKKHLLFVRSSKLRERIDAATKGANRAAQIALQKADIAISRTSTAKDRAEQADYAALQSKEDSDVARLHANEFDPAFRQPFAQGLPQEDFADLQPTPPNHYPSTSALHHPPHTALPPDQLSPGEPDSATLSPDLSPPMLTPPSEMPPPFQPSPTQPAAAPPEEQPSTSGAGPSGSQAPLQPQLSEERAIVHAPPEAAQPPAQPVAPPPAPVQQTPPATRNRPGPPIKQTSFGSQGGGREERRPESAAPSAVAASAESPYHHNLPGSPHGRLPRLPAAVDFKDSGGGGEEGVRRRRGERSHERPTTTGRPVRSQSHDQRQAQPRSAASLTQILTDDHFDQYALAANPYAAKIAKLSSSSRQNTPRQRTEEEAEEEVGQEEAADAVPDLSPGGSNIRPAASALPLGQMTIIRRSTLATAQDWKGLAEAEGAPTPAAAQVKSSLERGSLPNLEVLDEAPVQMTREVASRLGSQRRQELQRMAEEDELRVHNPLRYLFHPSLLELFHRWKFFLLVLFVNACLSILFYNLLFFFATDDPDAS